MKEEDKRILAERFEKKDWEGFHEVVDAIMYFRLKELDPKLIEDLDKASEGATLWYS